MSTVTMTICDICGRKLEFEKDAIFKFVQDEDVVLHAHLDCLNRRVMENRMKTCNHVKIDLIVDFLFGEGKTDCK